jgi:RNA polymerase sigma-70 factor (ECF subfamily)
MTLRFPTTDWPLVAASRTRQSEADPERSRSDTNDPLAELCRLYWPPVYAYLRQRGHRPEEAEDLTQGFFVHLLAKRVLDRAEPERGRLRSLLLVCLSNYVSNERTRSRAKKRGGADIVVIGPSLGDAQVTFEPTYDMTPERIYERQWAMTLLRRVLLALRAEFTAAGNERVFDTLKSYLLGDKAEISYRDAASALNLTEGATRVTVHRLRRRYRLLLWAEVARTLRGPRPDVAGEIRHLLGVLQSQPTESRP